MISIIISSYDLVCRENIKKNIEATIGLPHEVIIVENNNVMGICAAYNIGAKQARYDLLVFCHEDILFQTKNWGAEIVRYFKEDESLGLLGAAGSTAKSHAPSGWFVSKRYMKANFVQKDKKKPSFYEVFHISKDQEVAVLDGMFLCTKRAAYNNYEFDSVNLKGFHGYDLDFSLGIGKYYKLKIAKNIVIEHLSVGTPNIDWVKSVQSVTRKWQHELPRNAGGNIVTIKELQTLEFTAMKAWLSICRKYKYKEGISIFTTPYLMQKAGFGKGLILLAYKKAIELFFI